VTATHKWPEFDQVLRSQALMDDMMKRCGVDVLELIRRDRAHSFTNARVRCRFCLSTRACREWLLSIKPKIASPPAFCSNAELFRACQAKGVAED
jgi:hypothetical protein